MTLPPALAQEIQKLSPGALVELYELDATEIGGPVYRWVSGTLAQALSAQVGAGATATVIPLDRLLFESPIGSDNTYVLTVLDALGAVVQTLPVTALGATTGAGGTVTQVTVATGFSSAPAAATTVVLEGPGVVMFGGLAYKPFPVTVTNYEKNGQGRLPVPRLTIDNTTTVPGSGIGIAAALVIGFGDALGAKVTRLRTFAQFLDGQPDADPSMAFAADVFLIDRKASQTKVSIQFDLAAAIDQRGTKLPARLILANSCSWIYRRWNGTAFVPGSCPYQGAGMFTNLGVTTVDPNVDRCGKKMSDCLLRYGQGAPLPYGGFPGAGLAQI